MAREFSTIVSLVGENPLPVYFGAHQFGTPNARIVLLHSKQTREAAVGIKSVLESQGFTCDLVLLDNPYDPPAVERACLALQKRHPESVLNFTGGTKVMSSVSLLAWHHEPEWAFYIEDNPEHDVELLHFLDGTCIQMRDDIPLDIDTLANLHGLRHKMKDTLEPLSLPDLIALFDESLRRSIFSRVRFDDDSGAEFDRLFAILAIGTRGPAKPDQELLNAWRTFRSTLSDETRCKCPDPENDPTCVPETSEEYKGSRRLDVSKLKKWYDFAAGGWLEQLVVRLAHCALVEEIGTSSAPPEVSNEEFTRVAGRLTDFEVDYATVVRNRLRYVSVTTSRNRKSVKTKLFEAIFRAEQLGGGLAYSSVVSLTDPESARILTGTMDRHSDRRQVFGVEDVRRWVNGDLSDLRDFLTQ